jgi:TRAP-type mannitol/chloroaromatic compound transport system substrate-binding protein
MNPFEIRAEMLRMAQDYLQKQQEINSEFAQDTFEQLVKQGKKVQEDWQAYAPKMYTFEDVLKEANKLYGFVKDVK